MAGFEAIPATIEWLLTGASEREPLPPETLGRLHSRYDRVLLVYFDAFGWFLAERHADHPLLVRAREEGVVAKVTSQFPSTTTAHTTTLHSALPGRRARRLRVVHARARARSADRSAPLLVRRRQGA